MSLKKSRSCPELPLIKSFMGEGVPDEEAWKAWKHIEGGCEVCRLFYHKTRARFSFEQAFGQKYYMQIMAIRLAEADVNPEDVDSFIKKAQEHMR